jgi:hypothetical protein
MEARKQRGGVFLISSTRQQFPSDNIFFSEANHKQFLTGDIEAHMLFSPSPLLRLSSDFGCK